MILLTSFLCNNRINIKYDLETIVNSEISVSINLTVF